jgi:CheY-like chemotaxis protein
MLARHALVVDDDADGREALAQLLEAQGYTVRQAENGRVALDLIAERLPCLLLLDLEMPLMSGWEVLAWIRLDPALGEMVIVVVSAAASPPPDVALVRKPCQVDHLLDTIRASHERRAKRVVS